VFIDRIYNDAKLKVTSRFYKINHLPYETVKKWLQEEGFSSSEIELIWEYLGGSIAHIQRMIRDKHEYSTLKEYLERQKWLAYTEIVHFLNFSKKIKKEEREQFYEVCREILGEGYFEAKDDSFIDVIAKFAEIEILFFDPLDVKITGNSRIYEKGMEILVRSK
jgi:hypothetical protein